MQTPLQEQASSPPALFALKKYVLVNRENLQKVLEEMALQQTGLIDDRQAVKTGKGLAANQVVTGRLGLPGFTFFRNIRMDASPNTLSAFPGPAAARFP